MTNKRSAKLIYTFCPAILPFVKRVTIPVMSANDKFKTPIYKINNYAKKGVTMAVT